MSQRIGNNQGATIGSLFGITIGAATAAVATVGNLAQASEVMSSVVLQKAQNFAEVSAVTDAANLALIKAEIAVQLAAVAESADSATAAKLSKLDLG